MFNQNHILVLLAADEDNAIAVEKAAAIAKATNSKLTLLSCAYNSALNNNHPNAEHARDAFLSKALEGLETLAQVARGKGVKTSTEAIWEKHAVAGLINYLSGNPADLVLKATHHQSAIQRTFFSQTDWELIRQCSVPLLLCKANAWRSPVMLSAAVDPVGHFDHNNGSDEKVIACMRSLSDAMDGRMELLHVYDPTPMMVYLDQPAINSTEIGDEIRDQHKLALTELAKKYHFKDEQIKLEMGSPVQIIPDYLHENDVDIVVMGSASRKGIERWLLGHTAEKVLDRISIDILIAG